VGYWWATGGICPCQAALGPTEDKTVGYWGQLGEVGFGQGSVVSGAKASRLIDGLNVNEGDQ